LRDAHAMGLGDLRELGVQHLELVEHGVVGLRAGRTLGHRMRRVVLARKRALLEHHVREEHRIVLVAPLQDARIFRAAVDQAEVVLHRADLQAALAQDRVGLLDLGQVVVRYADHGRIGLAVEEFRERAGPLRRLGGVVHPVNVEAVEPHELELHVMHVSDGVRRRGVEALRGKLVGNQVALARQPLQEFAEHLLGSSHAIGIGGIPQVQPSRHGRVENGPQLLGSYAAAERAIVSPGPGAKRDFGERGFRHDAIPFRRIQTAGDATARTVVNAVKRIVRLKPWFKSSKFLAHVVVNS